ncbi:MAG: hypothetical protein QXU67_05385, partial [Candidatus Bathyarchaeia archaeon]
AALHASLYIMTPPETSWRSFSIYLEPLEGVILGPLAGFVASFIGSAAARTVKPDPLWMFGIFAEPMGVLACALLAKRRWKPLAAIYAFMLVFYFIHPYGRQLPLWTIVDIFVAYMLIYPVSRFSGSLLGENSKRLVIHYSIISFISVVTDSLTRVFLFVPLGLYSVVGIPTFELLEAVFIAGAFYSYIEDGISLLSAILVGVPILLTLRRTPFMHVISGHQKDGS